jgi:hypothetical protein
MIHLSKRHGNYRYAAEQLKGAVDLLWWMIPVYNIDAMRVVDIKTVPENVQREIYHARERTLNAIRNMT